MWNSKPAKIIRWIIYLPLAIFCLLMIYFLFIYAISVGLAFFFSSWWKILLVFIFAGLVWELIKIVSMYLSFFVVSVCPNKPIGSMIMSITTSIIFGFLLYKIWAVQYDYSFKVILFCGIVSILIMKLWYNILFASSLPLRQYY